MWGQAAPQPSQYWYCTMAVEARAPASNLPWQAGSTWMIAGVTSQIREKWKWNKKKTVLLVRWVEQRWRPIVRSCTHNYYNYIHYLFSVCCEIMEWWPRRSIVAVSAADLLSFQQRRETQDRMLKTVEQRRTNFSKDTLKTLIHQSEKRPLGRCLGTKGQSHIRHTSRTHKRHRWQTRDFEFNGDLKDRRVKDGFFVLGYKRQIGVWVFVKLWISLNWQHSHTLACLGASIWGCF